MEMSADVCLRNHGSHMFWLIHPLIRHASASFDRRLRYRIRLLVLGRVV